MYFILKFYIISIFTLLPLQISCQPYEELFMSFDNDTIVLNMKTKYSINFNISNLSNRKSKDNLEFYSEKASIASVDFKTYEFSEQDISTNFITNSFNVNANFLGKTKIRAKICENDTCLFSVEFINMIVTRKDRIIDHVFTGSVAILVSLIYINFGCALDWSALKNTVKRPIGPIIGFFAQFLFMPIISYVSGKFIFPDNPEMQLGMFFAGVSPGGGASNIYTYMLNGNLNLSITMTTISTFAAFAMMPFWLFTLGKTIFRLSEIVVPYSRIATFAIGLIVPLGLGLLIQHYLPRLAKLMVRILKCFAGLLLIFIIIFAIFTNLYLFELFSWKIIVAGMCVPWLGYLMGYISAYLFRQNSADCLTIAIETGIQNTGISIFLLKFSLSQPEADLTTVVPVSIAIMTPIPMIIIYCYQLSKRRFISISEGKHQNLNSPDSNTLNENTVFGKYNPETEKNILPDNKY